MSPAEAPGPGARLWRASITLMAGGVLAQALPLLLGPWLTRLYGPAEWGAYALFAAVAANLAVVACARYDFALPIARDEAEAESLLALGLRIGAAVVAGSAVLGLGLAWVRGDAGLWALLPLTVAAAGAVQALSNWAGRAARFRALATARVLQHGGGALAQGGLGALLQALPALAPFGAAGLALGAMLGAIAALPGLRRPAPPGGWRGLWRVGADRRRAAARRHRDFPLLNTPHAFLGALQDAAALALLVGLSGDIAAGWWALALRYLKAPATLVGGSIAQALYPQLAAAPLAEGLRLLRRTVLGLVLAAAVLAGAIALAAPRAFGWAFGDDWAPAGELAQALALYVGAHFVASPLGVVTLAWRRQDWALKVALAGQGLFLAALAGGLLQGGPKAAAWTVSVTMAVFYAGYAAWLVSGRLAPGVDNPGANA